MHERKHLSHYDFIKQVALAWIKPSTYWPSSNSNSNKQTGSNPSINSMPSSATCPSANGSIVTRRRINLNKKNSTITEKTLDPYSGILRCRLDHSLNHLPVRNDKPENNCQLHYWTDKIKIRSQLMKCMTCNVTLCINCYKHFHEVANLKATNRKK